MKRTKLRMPWWVDRTTRSVFATVLGLALAAAVRAQAASAEDAIPKPLEADDLRAAVKDGRITYRLSTPEELEGMFGKPQDQRDQSEGDMIVRVLEFPGVSATFARLREFAGPFTLFELQVDGQTLDIGRDRPLVLRTVDDLGKLDGFRGLSGVSLAKLDLRDQSKAVNALTFDSRTVWPAGDKLPAGFDPVRLLEAGKNPGLGVRKLHAEGIDGRGVGMAIVDQPLLKDHEEYRDRLVTYREVDTDGAGPQMHGPAVASIAVGKTCGVAPGASLYYFAVPSWKWLGNEPWADQLEKIIALNRTLTNTPRIRVVSISLGAFSQRPNPARWSAAVEQAEENHILVVTCDRQFLRLATLQRLEQSPDPGANDYVRGRFGYPVGALCAPAANRTIAGVLGPQCYTYDRVGGLSWTVPYVAGVAALAWQVNPSIKPREMLDLLRRTAVKTSAGTVINPAAAIEAARARAEQH